MQFLHCNDGFIFGYIVSVLLMLQNACGFESL